MGSFQGSFLESFVGMLSGSVSLYFGIAAGKSGLGIWDVGCWV